MLLCIHPLFAAPWKKNQMQFQIRGLPAAWGKAGGKWRQGRGSTGLSATHVLLILRSAPSESYPKMSSTLAKIRHPGGFYGTAVSGKLIQKF